jgi:stringent starvation protein B
MTAAKPYLIRAIYEWLQDNNQTIYITVETTLPTVIVPREYIRNNQIILDISPIAIKDLIIGNDALEGKARFGEMSRKIYIPISAITAIYSQETQEGMAFPNETATINILKTENKIIPEKKKPTSKPKLTLVPGGLKDNDDKLPA